VTDDVVHLLRHGEVENPDKILYGRLPGFRLSALGEQMAKAAAQALAAATSRSSCPARWSARSRRPSRSRPSSAADRRRRAADRERQLLRGQAVGVGDGALRDPRNWWVLRDPFAPSWGESYLASRSGCTPRCRRPGPGRGARGGLRLAPAADLDAAPLLSASGSGTTAQAQCAWPA
jgi:hypothetical protein